jgi:hypothetical protein
MLLIVYIITIARMNVVVYIIITRMNVVDNLNSVKVINKPCVYSTTMRLSTFCGLHRDSEQFYST